MWRRTVCFIFFRTVPFYQGIDLDYFFGTGDDKLQEIYSDITSLTIPLSNGKPSQGREDVSSGAEKLEKRQRATSELEFDTITLLSALRTLALTSLTSPSFRHSLSHFISIITHDDLAAEKSEKEDIVIIVRKVRLSQCTLI